jgi:hypothetical protein
LVAALPGYVLMSRALAEVAATPAKAVATAILMGDM